MNISTDLFIKVNEIMKMIEMNVIVIWILLHSVITSFYSIFDF